MTHIASPRRRLDPDRCGRRRRSRVFAPALAVCALVLGSAMPAAAAEHDAVIALAVQVTADGNGPFTATDDAGGDTGPTNGRVRTRDAVTYRVSVNANGADAVDERFTVTAPDGTTWGGVPSTCAAGSAIDGARLTCVIGDVAEGTTHGVPVVLNVSGDLPNAAALTVTGEVTAANAVSPAPVTSPATVVSAAARYNLSADVHASRLRAGVVGPDGHTPGFQLVYPIAVDWVPEVRGQGLMGFERSAGPMRFTADLSEILGTLPSGAVLWRPGGPACGPNEAGDIAFTGLPGGAGGGAQAVVDSGTFDCQQDAVGGDVDVTIAHTVTDPDALPSRSLDDGSMAGGGETAYFVSGYLSLWLPNPPAPTSVDSVIRYSPLQTTSISGAANAPEPMADNSAHRSIVDTAPGIAQKLIEGVDADGDRHPGSAKRGDPWYTPGDVVQSTVAGENKGLATIHGVVLCDTFDRATQTLVRNGARWATTSGMATAVVQYAAYAMPSPAAGQQGATCSDAAVQWFDDPEDVPGGPDAVGAVRAVGDVPGGETGALYTRMELRDVPDLTRAYDFGHVRYGDASVPWIHDTSSDPALGAGPLSDSVVVTANRARVAKKIVDPGASPEAPGDTTTSTVTGATLEYVLSPTLTNGRAAGLPSSVELVDDLPATQEYESGSASIEPVVETVTDDTGTHQRLSWTLPDVRPNQNIAPVTYRVHVRDDAPLGRSTNTVVVSSPTDKSDAALRQAQRSVLVVAARGITVAKRAVAPVVLIGDAVQWDLSYTNTDDSDLRAVDLIDVLPRSGVGGSSFSGSIRLRGAPELSGSIARYTSARPASVDLDASAASNAPGGATRWCTEQDFGSAGCPASFAAVTALRVTHTAPVAPGEEHSFRLRLVADGASDGDVYANRFGVAAANLALPVRSNTATVRVVAGSIGDRVWDDADRNGIQDDDEAGVSAVAVRLAGTDDRGDAVSRTTSTDADGHYGFAGLRPGRYRVSFARPDGAHFTERFAGSDPSVDSNVSTTGLSDVVRLRAVDDAAGGLDGVSSEDTVDAGLVVDVPGPPPATGDPAAAGNGAAVDPPGGTGHGGAATTARPAGQLAFTGPAVSLAALLVAAAALTLGGVLVARRRQRRHEG